MDFVLNNLEVFVIIVGAVIGIVFAWNGWLSSKIFDHEGRVSKLEQADESTMTFLDQILNSLGELRGGVDTARKESDEQHKELAAEVKSDFERLRERRDDTEKEIFKELGEIKSDVSHVREVVGRVDERTKTN